jgi:glycerate dehydrogenase
MDIIRILDPEAHTKHPDMIFPVPEFPHVWDRLYHTSQEELAEKARGYQILVINKLRITAEILDRLPDLRMIAMFATGYNNIDVAACQSHGVALANIRGYGTESVAEHALGLMLTLARNTIRYRESVRDLTWSHQHNFCLMDYPITDLFRKKLLIIGYGAIGKRLAEICHRGLDMEILISERKGAAECRPGRISFTAGLQEADFVSINCPFLPETRGLIGEPELNLMKPGAFLINTGRGGIVNEADLARALQENRLGGAGLDTLEKEPPAPDNPLIALLSTRNLIITPHAAWLGDIAKRNIGGELVKNMEAFVRGEERNRIV